MKKHLKLSSLAGALLLAMNGNIMAGTEECILKVSKDLSAEACHILLKKGYNLTATDESAELQLIVQSNETYYPNSSESVCLDRDCYYTSRGNGYGTDYHVSFSILKNDITIKGTKEKTSSSKSVAEGKAARAMPKCNDL